MGRQDGCSAMSRSCKFSWEWWLFKKKRATSWTSRLASRWVAIGNSDNVRNWERCSFSEWEWLISEGQKISFSVILSMRNKDQRLSRPRQNLKIIEKVNLISFIISFEFLMQHYKVAALNIRQNNKWDDVFKSKQYPSKAQIWLWRRISLI